MRHSIPASLLSLLSLSLATHFSYAASSDNSNDASSSFPQVQFSSLGTVLLTGSFAGLQFPPNSEASSDNQTQLISLPPASANASSVLSRSFPSGQFSVLGSTPPGGIVSAVCQSPHDGRVYVGGLFETINSVQSTSNVAVYDPASSPPEFKPLVQGLSVARGDSGVESIDCSAQDGVYFAGGFDAPNGASADDGFGRGIAKWDFGSNSWQSLPFSGFQQGAVNKVKVSPDGNSLLVGGSFRAQFSQSMVTPGSAGSNASTSGNANSTLPPTLGSSLLPLSLNSSDWEAGPTTYKSGFGRPQYVFCPDGPDGVGDSWLLTDGSQGHFTIRLFRALQAGGVRIGNTFVEGRGTRSFRLVSIPDNKEIPLTHYTDPANPTTSPVESCNPCTLGHNDSIPYEDFLFPPNTVMTGFQLVIESHYGRGAGLHLLQLLSEGSYSFAVDSENGHSERDECPSGLGRTSGGASSASTQGNWSPSEVPVDGVPGTTEHVLISDVGVGTPAAALPSVSWTPFVPQTGPYEIFLVTPGCSQDGTCARRTSVDVTTTVNGAGGAQVNTSTTSVDQTNRADESTLVYNGTLIASGQAGGQTEVALKLARNPQPIAGDSFHLIADKIQLRALSTNGSFANADQTSNGLFEWVLAGAGTFGDGAGVASQSNKNASTIMTNSTSLDRLGVGLGTGAIVNSIEIIPNQIFVGGNFTYNNITADVRSANVITYAGGQPAALATPNGGLNGPVNGLKELDGYLYAVGGFSETADGSVTNVNGIARWQYGDVGANWEPLGGLPDGNTFSNDLVDVGVSQTNDDGRSIVIVVGGHGKGFALYEPRTNTWNTTSSGFFIGNLSALGATGTGNDTSSFFAGVVQAATQYSAPSGAFISAGSNSNSLPNILPLSITFDGDSTQAALAQDGGNKKHSERLTRSFVKEVAGLFSLPGSKRDAPVVKRQSSGSGNGVNATLPSALPRSGTTPEILAGGFWQNGSDMMLVFGGRFETDAGVANLGIYNTSGNAINTLDATDSISGTVNSILVNKDKAWIGGDFSTAASNRQGLVSYDLSQNVWNTNYPPLQGYPGQNATVNVVLQRPSQNTQIIMAGAFATAGSLPCPSVCMWDSKASQWSALGVGLQGVVGAIDFAGSKDQYLIAAGNFQINGSTAFAAQYNFNNQEWTSLDGSTLPGPATAVSSNNFDDQNVFAAGVAGDAPYMMRWNGSSWSDVNANGMGSGSTVQQLKFVPVSNSKAGNKSIIQSDRMLLVSGSLSINSSNVSTALFDGASWYPYLTSVSSNGTPGVISSFLYSATGFRLSNHHHLSTGVVILISIAISLGIVFFLVLIGLLVALCHRSDDNNNYPVEPNKEEENEETHHRPTSLLAAINAATTQALSEKKDVQKPPPQDAYAGTAQDPHDSQYPESVAEGAAVAEGLPTSSGGEGEEPRMARARFSFHAENPDEINVSEGEDVVVLDNSHDIWWFVQSARDPDRRGVLPASYVF